MLPGICCIYFSNPFLISSMAPTTTGIVVAFIPHILSISISRALYYFDSFSVTLTEVFFSVGMDISMSRQLFSCFSWLPCLVCWPLTHDLSVLAYPTRLWCCLCLLLFGAHACTISRFCLYSSLCRCSIVSMWRLCCVCVGIQFWPVEGTLPQYSVWSTVSWNWPQILHIGSVPSFRILLR